jgi:hypothetical protein
MSYIGYIDSIRGRVIRGWAHNAAAPVERVALRILCEEREIGSTIASIYRPDLQNAGIGDGRHGFEYEIEASLPATARYQVRVAGAPYHLVDSTLKQRKRADEAFLHSHIDGLPSLRHGFSRAKPRRVDVAVAKAMIAAWRSLVAPAGERFIGSANMWEIHAEGRQRAFFSLLQQGDARALAEYCIGLPAHAITHGLSQGDEQTEALANASPAGLNGEACRYWDLLLALGEYLGVRNVECPEQGEWGRAMFADMDRLRARIDRALGFCVVPPEFFHGLFGLRYRQGIIHRRDIHACYGAHRLHEIAARRSVPVVEIGGGMGGAAYYARRLGLRDYTIVDLPVISLLQFYFLAKAFGLDQVAFVARPEDFRHDGRIQLVPAGLFSDDAIGGFELAFNMDSFPEMGAAVAGSYLRELERRGVRTLFSINQEATAPLTEDVRGERQACVRELARATRYQSVLRYPTWVHKGYVDEVFVLRERA